jgi:hypothetical protein
MSASLANKRIGAHLLKYLNYIASKKTWMRNFPPLSVRDYKQHWVVYIVLSDTNLELVGLSLEVVGGLLIARILLAELKNKLPSTEELPIHGLETIRIQGSRMQRRPPANASGEARVCGTRVRLPLASAHSADRCTPPPERLSFLSVSLDFVGLCHL